MPTRPIRIFGLSMALLLLGVLALLGVREAVARPVVADFAPTRSPQEAAAIVHEAQAREAALRQSFVQQKAIDANQLPLTPTVYFEQTGHHLSNRAGFLDFWRANGQVITFGYPITEEFVENGLIVQYFERARFEYHPGSPGAAGEVQLGLVGRELAGLHYGEFAPVDDPQNGASYFPETRHTLWGEFRHYWQKRGGLPIYGFPISENFDDNGRVVQFFERAKFEYFPEDMNGFLRSVEHSNGFNLNTLFEVRLSDLGRQLAAARGIDVSPLPALPGAAIWSPALWPRHIEVNLSEQWLTAYEGDLIVYRAPVATGKDGFNTPTGNYAIYDRYSMQTMTGSAGGETWNVPNIPWVMYVVGGVALHGTYWHDAHGSGVRMSHGCINLRIDDAEWLYRWADLGTTVSISY